MQRKTVEPSKRQPGFGRRYDTDPADSRSASPWPFSRRVLTAAWAAAMFMLLLGGSLFFDSGGRTLVIVGGAGLLALILFTKR